MAKIYTKKGDSGTTSLIGGERVAKNDLRVEAYGAVDELISHTSYLRELARQRAEIGAGYGEQLLSIINVLMNLSASLATSAGAAENKQKFGSRHVEDIERQIDELTDKVELPKQFTISSGDRLVAYTSLCRTVARRAERALVGASQEYELESNCLKYINRLSDYLYLLERMFSKELNIKEEYWQP